MTDDLEVVSTGDRMTFRVLSINNPDGYIVDIAALDGNGHCLCRDFQCRCQPHFKRETQIVNYGKAERTRCRHINAVLLFLGDQVARNAAKLYHEQDKQKHT